MITFIRIADLGVIDRAEVELAPGMVALTGETGAGKTMVVTALDLLFGGRADASVVRSGAGSGWVEAGLDVEMPTEIADRLDEAGIDIGEELVVARTVSAGRSRAHVAGRTVPAATLRELGDGLVARHGQHDQQRLASASRRRHLLDAFGGETVAAARARYRALFDRYAASRRALAELDAATESATHEADVLTYGLSEIEAVAPQPGEDEELAAEARRLDHVVDLRSATERAHALLSGEDAGFGGGGAVGGDVQSLLAGVEQELRAAVALDESLAPTLADLTGAAAVASDIATTLGSYSASLEADPGRLEFVNERRAAISALQRRYGPTIDDVLAWAENAQRRLNLVEDSTQQRATLLADLDSIRGELAAAAEELHAVRAAAAQTLAQTVDSELAALAMPNASFEVAVSRHTVEAGDGRDALLTDGGDRVAFGPSGCDTVEFLLRPHPGAAARPLTDSASGGEISRVMLALYVALAEADPVPVMVFDEVDAGVGGKAAVEVGRRLARLARHTQVLVVTHLAQVAAFADHHVVVTKTSDGLVTSSTVTAVSGETRVTELARMLGGLETSATAAAHAVELLDLAATER